MRFFDAKLGLAFLASLRSAIIRELKLDNLLVTLFFRVKNRKREKSILIFLKISNFYQNFSISKTASSLLSLIPFPILASLSINFKASIFSSLFFLLLDFSTEIHEMNLFQMARPLVFVDGTVFIF